ncbi:MAG: potassium-transporting ATPase subunit KdpA [Rickettsiaceae bacterium]|nr:potassium-transporting ATPase subunit KdpA [Rickettsiaceae bacterium]
MEMLVASLIFFMVITIFAPIIGKYVAKIYTFKLYKILPINNHNYQELFHQQTWRYYFLSLMFFNIICLAFTIIIIYFQEYLPLNNNLDAKDKLSFAGTLNAAISFTTGTFCQSHHAETQLTLFSQLFALTMQNFLSGATSIAVFIAFTRGINNNNNPYIGNFYSDFLRGFIFILLPAAIIISLFLINNGVPYDFTGNLNFTDISGNSREIYIGPIAGQMSIKNLISNGGSVLASASSHPFEAPNRIVVMFSLFSVVLLPIAMIFTYGFLVNALRLSWSLYFVIIIIMIASLLLLNLGETNYGIPLILESGQKLGDNFNYLGKELIYDKFPSLMWILSITTSSCGSVNSCLENYSPLSTLVLFSNLIISKFVMEGIGAGFFAMLSYLIVAVFLRGLVTGETSNFFGKRITINEINYVIIVFLVIPVGILIFTAITLYLPYSRELITHHGSQAVTDITYNFASSFANNGSHFSGIDISSDYFNYMTALAMFIGRYTIIYYSLAISGSFANKQKLVDKLAKLNQSNLELCLFLVITVLLVSAIMFLPMMILGPLLELMSVHTGQFKSHNQELQFFSTTRILYG